MASATVSGSKRPRRLLTADEFLYLPDDPSGGKMELLDGEVVVMAPPGEEHGETAGEVYSALRGFVRPRKLGRVLVESGFVIRHGPDRVLGPDVAFIAEGSQPADRDRRKFSPEPPTLAVEVVSPGDIDAEVAAKVQEYLDAGTARVWVVRPQLKSVTVHRPGGDAHTYGANDHLSSDDAAFSVEGFDLHVGSLFE